MRTVLILTLVVFTLPGRAQEYVNRFRTKTTPRGIERLEAPVFGTGDYFKTHFAPVRPLPDVRAPARLADFVVDGRLELSLKAYLELVLANNPDVAIQRLSIEAPRNAITRALAQFDPTVTASFRSDRTQTPTADVLQGAETLNQLIQPFSLTFNQLLPTGTQYSIGFSARRRWTNSVFATINPAIDGTLNFSVTQPLLRNRGSRVNKLQFIIAQSRFRQSRYSFEDRLLQLLSQAENVYWSVVEARENLRVAEENLRLNEALLERSERELELGAISPLDIYQPQQNLENARLALTEAHYRLEQTLDALRRQIGADLDPDFRYMPIVLTEPVLPPSEEEMIDPEQMVETAYRLRPDLKGALQSLKIDDLTYELARNALRPDLSLSLNYRSSGLGGTIFQFAQQPGLERSPVPLRTIPGGLGDALEQIFGFDFPSYSFTLSLRLPLRDRRAVADLADVAVSKKANMLRAQSLQQDIRLQVLNAVSQVESSRARVKLAQTALEFSRKRLEAEQKKYDLGVTTIFLLIQAQNDLVAAESQVVTQATLYRRNLVNLLRVTGRLLEERGVVITDKPGRY